MSEFNALVDDVKDVLWEQESLLAKSRKPDADDAADEQRIKAAADGDADDDGEPDSDDATDDYEDSDEGEDAPMAKSFTVTLEDGTEAAAYDGEAVIKSFRDQVSAIRGETKDALVDLAKALAQSAQLIKALREQSAEQAALIKAQGDRLAELAGAGRGRKSSLSVHERPVVGDEALAKAAGPDPSSLLSKALTAQRDGRMTGMEVAQIDACLHRGMTVPDALLAKLST